MFDRYAVFSILCWCVLCKEIPPYIHLCKRNDPEVAQCFVNTLNEIMPHLVEGIPEMDVPSIDPLSFSTIQVNTGNGGSVSMELRLINGTATGLKKLEVKDHVMDFEHVQFSAELYLPQMNIEANYQIKGKILLFEINGEGPVSFNASHVRSDGVWYGAYYMKKDKQHIRIENIEFNNVDIDNLSVRLDHLFGENDILTDTVNNAINNNINSLKEELEPLIKETLAEVIRDYFNRVYRMFPFDQLYPND